jgi:transcriptional regulator with PAS, ATPase and Fis domain
MIELPGIIYQSDKIEKIIQFVKKIAPSDMNVLIMGESGTGKELIANAIHKLSNRKIHQFVPVNCGALPEQLLESELFGHEKGAFTNAIKTKPGLFEFANKGTFLFDEVCELPLSIQAKLLRALEERKIRRVGGNDEIEIDMRVISATNNNLKQLLDKKKFREDLYFRLNTIEIEIPPLRKRKDDILLLANYFLSKICMENGKNILGFSSDVKEILISYHWPGNVRELKNIIGSAYYLSSPNIIQSSDLKFIENSKSIKINNNIMNMPYKKAKEKALQQFDLEYIKYRLAENKGNVTQTAVACGIDRRSVHRLINKYNIILDEETNENY